MGKCKFNKAWLEDEHYKHWIQSTSDSREARCKLCLCVINVARMGESALRKHMETKKHVSALKTVNSTPVSIADLLQGSERRGADNGYSESVSIASLPNNLLQYVNKETVIRSEIIWALTVVKNHYSYKSCEGIRDTFKAMFPDSATADRFSFSERKAAYYACHGLYPQLKTVFRQKVGKEPYVLLFDESLNKFTQSKQMDILLRQWEESIVTTKYYTSAFMGHARASDMLTVFQNEFDISMDNVLQLSMDGPTVNWSFYDKLDASIENNRTMLNIGSCGLHIVHNAFKRGATATGWNIESLLTSLYYLFKDAPARREDYMKITESENFPKKFCCHRWLDNTPCAERALLVWPNIVKYVEHVETKFKKANKPSCKSYEVVKNAASDKLTIAKLNAFLSVSSLLKPFLTMYQTDRPMLPFLADDLHNILKLLMKRFIKSDVLRSADSLAKLTKVDVDAANNHCDHSKIDVGFVAESKLKELVALCKLSERQQLEFRMEVKSCLVAIVSKILEKAPVKYVLVRCLNCLNPNVLATRPEESKRKFKRVLTVLVTANHVQDLECDSILNQFEEFVDTNLSKSRSEFVKFDKKTDRVDTFYHERMNKMPCYSKLWPVCRKLLMLSHGQATVERGFSINRQVEVENLDESSYIAQRFICDYVNSVGGVLNVQITPELIVSVASAHSRYQVYLKEKNKQHAEDLTATKRKREEDIVHELKSKKRLVEIDINSFTSSADDYAKQASKSNRYNESHSLIIKSVSMRESASEKQEELSSIEKHIGEHQAILKSL